MLPAVKRDGIFPKNSNAKSAMKRTAGKIWWDMLTLLSTTRGFGDGLQILIT